ncbi:MAG: serine protease [Sinobacteraceae bacterium]|nr:serine protease [Nevskiaceae bacterium]
MTAAVEFDVLRQTSATLSGLLAAAAPSVVAVHSHRSRCSGFVWKNGLVITAEEALAEDSEIVVTLPTGMRTAELLGRDPSTDVALLRVETGDLPPISLDSDLPPMGAIAVAVGRRETEPLAAWGIVSSLGSAWLSMRGGQIDARIELDLALQRSAEGGVVLDASGRVLGMCVCGPRESVLVIPAATVGRVAKQLEAEGRVARGYLGLALKGVRLAESGSLGARVVSVAPNSPGFQAGVRAGDIIESWEGRPIGSVARLLRLLGPASVGKTVTLSLRRNGESQAVQIHVAARP